MSEIDPSPKLTILDTYGDANIEYQFTTVQSLGWHYETPTGHIRWKDGVLQYQLYISDSKLGNFPEWRDVPQAKEDE
jgi:hypothetical protein